MDRIVAQIVEKLPIHCDRRNIKEWPREADLKAIYAPGPSDLSFTLIASDENSGEYLEVPKEQAHLNCEAPGALKFDAFARCCDFDDESSNGTNYNCCGDELQDALTIDARAAVDFEKLFEYSGSSSVPPGFNYGVDFTKSAQIDSTIEDFDHDSAPPDSVLKQDVAQRAESDRHALDLSEYVSAVETPCIASNSNVIVLDRPSTKSDLQLKPTYQYAKLVDVRREAVDFHTKVPVPAHQYPFELATFQKRAVMHMEDGDTVFVAAHTSAGKTAVAEYAVALCQRHSTRVIYTSPIKALSNQKYRDFKRQFGSVGLITGDVQLNTHAFCLIMTTEILRSMLLNNSEVIRDLEWVVFDEVHYVNDQERGVVWEEVLIFLPRTVKIVMLSATVSNTMEFADWVGRLKDRNVYVISTPKRPVPLEHFLYTGSDGKTKNNRFLLIDKEGNLRKDGYEKAKESKKPRIEGTKKLISTSKNPQSEKNMWVHLLDHLKTNDLLPCVAFTFSRRRCDENASVLTSIDLTTTEEKSHVHHFFDRCLAKLRGSDQNLPQVRKMAELCKRGIAIHHSGILPILKESVEMLFQKGCIKVLFATETFAMGVNMPARTVLFDSVTKHDGSVNRTLHAGEYTQMAGRAGRRGIDSTGTVIILCKADVPELHVLHAMILGKPAGLISQFRVTYPLLLNSLRAEQFQVEDVLRGSFAETSSWREKLLRRDHLAALDKKLVNLAPLARCHVCLKNNRLQRYYALCLAKAQRNRRTRRRFLADVSALKPGTVVHFGTGPFADRLGVVLKVDGGSAADGRKAARCTADAECRLVVAIIGGVLESAQRRPFFDDRWAEVDLQLFDIAFCGAQLNGDQQPVDLQVDYDSSELESAGDWRAAKQAHSTMEISGDHVTKLCIGQALDDQSINALLQDHEQRKRHARRFHKIDERISDAIQRLKECQNASEDQGYFYLNSLSATSNEHSDSKNCSDENEQEFDGLFTEMTKDCPTFTKHFTAHHESEKIEQAKRLCLEEPLKDTLQLSPAYFAKLETLKDLGYADERNLLTMKGKVACYINNFELLVSELMLDNMLTPLEPCEIAAVLSCTTSQHKNREHVHLPPNLFHLKTEVINVANRICAVQRKNQVEDNDLSRLMEFSLMDVVYEWAKGTPFVEITQMTSAQEGIIVRCIMRLDEVCRDVRSAARLLGDPVLQAKMEQTSQAIHRDIVFAASLYTVM